jgi:hypothetical protein
MDGTQYCLNENSSQFNLQIKHNANQNPNKLFDGCYDGEQQRDSNVYLERKRLKKSWRTDMT